MMITLLVLYAWSWGVQGLQVETWTGPSSSGGGPTCHCVCLSPWARAQQGLQLDLEAGARVGRSPAFEQAVQCS